MILVKGIALHFMSMLLLLTGSFLLGRVTGPFYAIQLPDLLTSGSLNESESETFIRDDVGREARCRLHFTEKRRGSVQVLIRRVSIKTELSRVPAPRRWDATPQRIVLTPFRDTLTE